MGSLSIRGNRRDLGEILKKQADASPQYHLPSGKEILGLGKVHFCLYKLLKQMPNLPEELVPIIITRLYLHEVFLVVEDALLHDWRVKHSKHCSYLRPPDHFEGVTWAQYGGIYFQHPRHGQLYLSNLEFNEEVRRTGTRK
jgi:hypothetical protein